MFAPNVKICHCCFPSKFMYKFKSRITGDLIMLEPNGRQILQILGKGDAASLDKGILIPEHMPHAVITLENAIAQDEEQRKQRAQEAHDKGETLPRSEAISLRLRATPLIAMIKRCHKENADIVWGV
jgi:cyclopropane-fatty-acyl-phospholipid synthase